MRRENTFRSLRGRVGGDEGGVNPSVDLAGRDRERCLLVTTPRPRPRLPIELQELTSQSILTCGFWGYEVTYSFKRLQPQVTVAVLLWSLAGVRTAESPHAHVPTQG